MSVFNFNIKVVREREKKWGFNIYRGPTETTLGVFASNPQLTSAISAGT